MSTSHQIQTRQQQHNPSATLSKALAHAEFRLNHVRWCLTDLSEQFNLDCTSEGEYALEQLTRLLKKKHKLRAEIFLDTPQESTPPPNTNRSAYPQYAYNQLCLRLKELDVEIGEVCTVWENYNPPFTMRTIGDSGLEELLAEEQYIKTEMERLLSLNDH